MRYRRFLYEICNKPFLFPKPMKKLLFLISFLSFSLQTVAQLVMPLDSENRISYSEVSYIEDGQVEIRQSRARDFLSRHADITFRIDQGITDLLTAKGRDEIFGEGLRERLVFTFRITIDIKESRFRYVIDQLTHSALTDKRNPRPVEFSASRLYQEYLAHQASGKRSTAKDKRNALILRVMDRKIRDLIQELKAAVLY